MVQYIDKDAVLAIIQLEADIASVGESFDKKVSDGKLFVCKQITRAVNSLKAKEVELDMKTFGEEMTNVFNLLSNETTNTEKEPLNLEYAIAKHFFELGLKAQKGE